MKVTTFTPPPPDVMVNIEMTRDDALVLRDIMNFVHGNSEAVTSLYNSLVREFPYTYNSKVTVKYIGDKLVVNSKSEEEW